MQTWVKYLVDFLLAFGLSFRYTRTLVSIYTYLTFKPYLIADNPKYRSQDVTVIIPTTFKTPVDLVKCIHCISKCSPAQIFVVTADGNVNLVKDLCILSDFQNVTVLGTEKLNKRRQLLRALPEVKTEIVVFADDDVFWPDGYLVQLLAIFEDPEVGAGGTRQRVRRSQNPNMWNFLGIAYLERRVWNNISTNAIDGSLSTLSGRSAAYRTHILKNAEFTHYFLNDAWRGRPLNTDDDKCLTRYVYSHGWKIAIQTGTLLETTLEDNPQYIEQCFRWARAHWRGNLTVMENETYWRSRKHLWGFYAIYLAQYQTPAFLVDGTLLALLWLALLDTSFNARLTGMLLFVAWILFTKNLKMIPHYCRHPADMKFIPLSILASYVHGYINVKARFTLRNTSWGSQKLEELEQPKAPTNAEVVPLLQETMAEVLHQDPEEIKIDAGHVSLPPTTGD